jgi:hypothetical protein
MLPYKLQKNILIYECEYELSINKNSTPY